MPTAPTSSSAAARVFLAGSVAKGLMGRSRSRWRGSANSVGLLLVSSVETAFLVLALREYRSERTLRTEETVARQWTRAGNEESPRSVDDVAAGTTQFPDRLVMASGKSSQGSSALTASAVVANAPQRKE
jgi:hypothetical protein